MKNKYQIWYLGYAFSVLLLLAIFLTDFPKMTDLGLAVLFSAVFSVSHTQLLHGKMIKSDKDYKIEAMDERNMAIKEKAGNVTNMVNMVLLGLATVIFIAMDYITPAIITGAIVALQPVILILISSRIEKNI